MSNRQGKKSKVKRSLKGGDDLGERIKHAILDGDIVKVREYISNENVNKVLEDRHHISWTPMQWACAADNDEMLDILVREKGANLLSYEGSNEPLIHIACESGSTHAVRYLLEHGVPINTLDSTGQTALHEATIHRTIDSVELLLNFNINVNIQDGSGDTALHSACYNDSTDIDDITSDITEIELDIVELLLEHGANTNLTNAEGLRPIDLARENGRNDIVGILQQHQNGNVHRQVAAQNTRIVPMYDTLSEGTGKVGNDTDLIGEDMYPLSRNNTDNAKAITNTRFFYDDRTNVNPSGELHRVYAEGVLERMRRNLNIPVRHPISYNSWTGENSIHLKKADTSALEASKASKAFKAFKKTHQLSQAGQTSKESQASSPTKKTRFAGGKGGANPTNEYVTFDNRKYLVHHGSKGGRYIYVNDRKMYLKKKSSG